MGRHCTLRITRRTRHRRRSAVEAQRRAVRVELAQGPKPPRPKKPRPADQGSEGQKPE